jgi:hypothetical protein
MVKVLPLLMMIIKINAKAFKIQAVEAADSLCESPLHIPFQRWGLMLFFASPSLGFVNFLHRMKVFDETKPLTHGLVILYRTSGR